MKHFYSMNCTSAVSPLLKWTQCQRSDLGFAEITLYQNEEK